jgi:hypothetical protein
MCHAFPDNAAYGDPDYPWEAYINKNAEKIWAQGNVRLKWPQKLLPVSPNHQNPHPSH